MLSTLNIVLALIFIVTQVSLSYDFLTWYKDGSVSKTKILTYWFLQCAIIVLVANVAKTILF